MLDVNVYMDVAGRDLASYVREIGRLIREQVKLPAGYSIVLSGQFEAVRWVRERLMTVVGRTDHTATLRFQLEIHRDGRHYFHWLAIQQRRLIVPLLDRRRRGASQIGISRIHHA